MSESLLYPVSGEWARRAYVDANTYKELYQRSITDPEGFWGERRAAASTGSSPLPR